MNSMKCMRNENFSCSCCLLKHSDFTHIIKGYSKSDGTKISVLITCRVCGSVVFKGDFWEKCPNSRISVQKTEFEQIFHSGQDNKIFQ